MPDDPTFHRFRPHPWHGMPVGPRPPEVVTAFIEITPLDVIKYELDKRTGYLRVDRPLHASSAPPVLYGLIPRTYCAERVAALSPEVSRADGDPLDICVISERPITRADVLVDALVIGGLRMIDGGEADDKILAVLDHDPFWSGVTDVSDVPQPLVDRVVHYFLSYKSLGDETAVEIPEVYGREHAQRVIDASIADYAAHFDAPTS